jgi:DICT domain-containing protein
MTKFTDSPVETLSIGELARRSSMPTATLRTWEARYGFPTPLRQSGGHRRYQTDDVRLLAEVSRLRGTGLSVPAAIAAAQGTGTPPHSSFFAHLRAQRPELTTQVLTKRVLLAVSRAIEDEYCARAARPVLFASFQRQLMYRRSERRWRELARTAAFTTVFADFERARKPVSRLIEVPVPKDAPVLREWTLICDSPDYPACVAGWELPDTIEVRDADRRFEVIWTLDGRAVREASRVGLALLARTQPTLAGDVGQRLSNGMRAESEDLRNATTLFARILSYTQQASRRDN